VKLGVQNRYSYGKLARLMDRLVEAGVMDDTVIIMAGDMGDPALHSSRDIPVVVAGNAGGKLKTGVRIKLAADCPPDNMWCTPKTDNSMTKLLVSVANAFGANVNGLGSESNVGPLSEIEA
jgi:arylsulfatase A-like enzyme